MDHSVSLFHPSWNQFLQSEFDKPYFHSLSHFLHTAYQNHTIYPKKSQVFSAFSTDLNQIKVIILGQDPYHTPGAAHGLAFSVPETEPIPPSLRNIYQAIENDLKTKKSRTGNLQSWQNQGVLLLNNVLTVEAHRPGSHRNQGWEIFTEAVIRHLNQTRPHLVFLLWGNDAKAKAKIISDHHLTLTAPHPSPLSAHRGFFDCRHFSKANQFLEQHQLTPIDW